MIFFVFVFKFIMNDSFAGFFPSLPFLFMRLSTRSVILQNQSWQSLGRNLHSAKVYTP